MTDRRPMLDAQAAPEQPEPQSRRRSLTTADAVLGTSVAQLFWAGVTEFLPVLPKTIGGVTIAAAGTSIALKEWLTKRRERGNDDR